VHAQIGEHVRVLRSLAGEEERELAALTQGLASEVDPAPVLDPRAGRIGEAPESVVELAREIGRVGRDEARPAVGSAFTVYATSAAASPARAR
jgi:hypothetical protein